MGEIKSVKVDNWGVFFLQKLQNFFNKTDYCDLTLQFNDNSQLKVHKLVLSACTDYFNVLEQTCEMIDDILIMPNELQADLVVPIVNFMYTGTLEFELKMYGKLLKTARDMNMTVLLKLLEAHRRTMEGGPKQVIRNSSPRATCLNPGVKTVSTAPVTRKVFERQVPNVTRGRIAATMNAEQYRKIQMKPMSTTLQVKSQPVKKGPTRFEYEGDNIPENYDSSFDNISYESKPLKTDEDNTHQTKLITIKQESSSSQFEQLRRTGYNNIKRPAQSVLQSPPAKKPNIQDVKEYAEQQRMRKQIAEEYDDDFDDAFDDDFHNADDDEEYIPPQHILSKMSNKQYTPSKVTTTSKQDQKPTIVVKDSSSSNVDHAKIISEVLRKYPHLIKNNKNIKLKIMPNSGGTSGTQKVVIKKEGNNSNIIQVPSTSKTVTTVQETKMYKPQQKSSPQQTKQPLTPPTNISQPRRIDSKTMKALIALGAENTTGPWLCLRCGVNGRPISIPSYRGFRRHLIVIHKEKIDPRLCEHCGWRSITHRELLYHMEIEHQIKSNVNFPKCEHCHQIVVDLTALEEHLEEHHPEKKEENQMCIYCNKTFSTENLLYNHMKAQHKERAREDGVIDFSDDENLGEFEDEENIDDNFEEPNVIPSTSKIQILSDINLPKCISLTQTNKTKNDESVETMNLATSLGLVDSNAQIISGDHQVAISGEGPKFVNADGNVMELTEAQRDEIISQLEQGSDGLVMVLNDESFATTKSTEASAEQASSTPAQNVYDQQQQENDKKSNEKSKDIGKETPEKHDEPEKDDTETKNKENLTEDLDMKLKLLTGDWTDDEEDENTDSREKVPEKDIDISATNPNTDNKILDILSKNSDASENDEKITNSNTLNDEIKDEIKIEKELKEDELDDSKNSEQKDSEKTEVLFSDEAVVEDSDNAESILKENDNPEHIDANLADKSGSQVEEVEDEDKAEVEIQAHVKEDELIENIPKSKVISKEDIDQEIDIDLRMDDLHSGQSITDVKNEAEAETECADDSASEKKADVDIKLEVNSQVNEASPIKTKNEIKTLISDWGEEDDEI